MQNLKAGMKQQKNAGVVAGGAGLGLAGGIFALNNNKPTESK